MLADADEVPHLEGALELLAADPAGLLCADLGASTGGFTDCLLQHGATRVHAVDVGRALLADKLRRDPRVTLHERTNARTLTAATLGEPVDLVVADCAFISLELLLPAIGGILKPGGTALVLVKPQFELPPGRVGPGGVVGDEAEQMNAVEKIERAARSAGFESGGRCESPLRGAGGNREFFLKLLKPPTGGR